MQAGCKSVIQDLCLKMKHTFKNKEFKQVRTANVNGFWFQINRYGTVVFFKHFFDIWINTQP